MKAKILTLGLAEKAIPDNPELTIDMKVMLISNWKIAQRNHSHKTFIRRGVVGVQL